MTLNTFATIKTAVADWAWGEVTTTLVGTDFFPQVWSKLYYGHGTDIQPLRIRAMVDSATLTPASGGVVTIATDVDSGWLEFIELTPTVSGGRSLDYMEPWAFRKRDEELASSASPQFLYTIEGAYLYVAPPSLTTITARWYQKFTALSADSDTDWLVTNAPGIYLDGCLMEACAYLQDDREAQFRAKFAAGIRALNLNDKTQRSSGSVKIARPRSVA